LQSVADTKEDTAVAALLGDIATAIEICSIIGWQYAGMVDRYDLYGPRHSVEIATKGRMHKMFVCDKAIEIAHKAMSIMGDMDVIGTWILKSTWGHKDDTTLDGRKAIMPDGNSKIVL